MAQILVVDDEIGIRELLSEILADEGHTIWLAENAAAARRIRGERRPDLVLLDIWMPDTDGISLLKEWSAGGALTMPVVMMSGHGTIDTAVEATRIGAVDFLEKPIALQKLLATVKKALRHDAPPVKPSLGLDAFARSVLLRDCRKRLEQAATRASVILLRGTSGVLAEACARTVQAPNAPWLDLGAESGPLEAQRLQAATGGVVFVSELANLGKLQQMNLAFALDRLERCNLLLVAATTRAPGVLAEAGWDSGLLARLGEVAVALPPLSDHPDEVPEVANALLTLLAERGEVPHRRLLPDALNALRLHRWTPEREDHGAWGALAGVVRNLALTSLEDDINGSEVVRVLDSSARENPGSRAQPGGPQFGELFLQPLRDARESFERAYLEHHIQAAGGNMTRVAERTGLERTHLYRKLKQLGISARRQEGTEEE